MITLQNLVRHELTGLEVVVAGSTNKAAIGLSGIVIGETRNTLTVETAKGEKRLIKDQCTFSFKSGGRWVKVDGRILVARPEDRIKKKLKTW
ncbi:MAG: ribonuclease P protein component 1 [Candidatus Aenigmarchaeota archaeon]|nr:ribonuclease P protein component 1 [Candidatus Aenigmarchaeota archaeon]